MASSCARVSFGGQHIAEGAQGGMTRRQGNDIGPPALAAQVLGYLPDFSVGAAFVLADRVAVQGGTQQAVKQDIARVLINLIVLWNPLL